LAIENSYITRFALTILLFIVFISILFCPAVASAVVDVTLAWDASSGADGYRLFYRAEGQSYTYNAPDWEGTGTTCIIPGLDESTTYHFVVRAFNDYGESGNSNEEHLYPSATNQAPNQPVMVSPYDGEIETDLLLTIQTEPFSDPDGDTHKETKWQIVKPADSSVILEIISNEHLTKLSVPHAVLDRNTTYNVSVQFFDAHSEPSPSSGPVEFTTHNGIVDFDGDGIPDAYEVDDTVDLNEDGIPDNDQPDVIKSILSAVADNKPVGVSKVSASIDAIETLEPINPATILNKMNKPETFLFGLASYRLRVNQFGATALVRVYYSGDILEANQYYLYNTVDGWHDYTQHTIFNEDGRSVTVELKDGGHGDSDGVANGIIVDPGGVVGAATTGGAESGGGGCFIATAAFRSRRAEEIKILKNFRDNVLLTNAVGKRFVRFYYQASPPIADFIAEHDSLRTVVSWSLLPVVGVSWMALQFGLIPTLALMLATLALVSILTVLFFRRIKMRGYQA